MALPTAPTPMTQHACFACIGEAIVRAEIEVCEPAPCSYCGAERPAIPLPALAQRVDAVYRHLVGFAPEGFIDHGDSADWGPVGDYPSTIVNEMLQADNDEIGRNIIEILAEKDRATARAGDHDWYDDGADIYTISDPVDGWFDRGWQTFCDGLKHERRFFLDQRASVLDEIFGPVLRREWPAGGALREIGPGTKDSHIFRGRPANEPGAQKAVYRERLRQLGAPPPGVAGSGRMNAAGISIFYGSFDRDTCVAELRTPVGGFAIVGRFEILRPLTVLDLTMLDCEPEQLSYFDPRYSEGMAYSAFMRSFHAEVRRAIIPGREVLDYLPTQVITEYLWSLEDMPIDGIVFGSAQISDSAHNVVLFPHAASVEGAEEEIPRRFAHFRYQPAVVGEEAYDGETFDRDVIVFKPVNDEDREGMPAKVLNDNDWFSLLLDNSEPVQPVGAALRLGDQDVWRMRVEGIRYETRAIQAEFGEDDPEAQF